MIKPRSLQRPLSDDAVVKEIIGKNIRGHGYMDELDKARCFAELRRLILRFGDEDGNGNEELRDRIARRLGFGLCGRSLERLARLLVLPQPIQDAVSQKIITKSLAERILLELPATQSQIASDLQAGKSRIAIAKTYGLTQTSTITPAKALSRLLKAIVTEVPRVAASDSLPDSRLLSKRNLSRIDVAIKRLTQLRDQHVVLTATDLSPSPAYRNLAIRTSIPREGQDKLSGP